MGSGPGEKRSPGDLLAIQGSAPSSSRNFHPDMQREQGANMNKQGGPH